MTTKRLFSLSLSLSDGLFAPFADFLSVRRIAPYAAIPRLRKAVVLWSVESRTLCVFRKGADIEIETENAVEEIEEVLWRFLYDVAC